MQYQEIFPQRMGESLQLVYSLGSFHGKVCGVEGKEAEHEQIKDGAATVIANAIENLAIIGRRLDVFEAKLQELGIDTEALDPQPEEEDTLTMQVIPTANGVPVAFIEG